MKPPWFAAHGGEKMVYDWRMRPQAIMTDEWVYVAFQAALQDDRAHPHVARLHRRTGCWATPVCVGLTDKANHHFAPVLWLDAQQRIHVLYHCHRSPGRHLVSARPHDLSAWTNGPDVADSMTYPSIWHCPDGRLGLMYREGGHLGAWVWRFSEDGGWNWSPPVALVTFNASPRHETDRWSGIFPTVHPGPDGLHLAFVRWEERDNLNPVYNTFRRDMFSRYDLYYLCMDWHTGRLRTVDGTELPRPLCRSEANPAQVFDSGHELTNSPSLALDANGQPLMVLPVSEGSPWRCRYTVFRREQNAWHASPLGLTDNTWSANLLLHDGGQRFALWLITGEGKDESCFYGGGRLRNWRSEDGGRSWQAAYDCDPAPGFLYNNPQPVLDEAGHPVADHLLFYGWEGRLWSQGGLRQQGYAFFYANGRFHGRCTEPFKGA